MKKFMQVCLIIWSVIMILQGISLWAQTLGQFQGSQFGVQVSMVSCLSSIMIWVALFGIWFSSSPSQPESNP